MRVSGNFLLTRSVFVAALAVLMLNCASSQQRDEAKFSYQNLYQDRYERGYGGIIPVTLERGESYSGTISHDQKYLYFSSNTSGNYDIYLRDLNDVFSVPVVTTATNQREPSISPDGKYLVYVDDELDPDGDIILLKVNPKKLIELHRDREQPGDEWFASRAKNLTNSEKKRIRSRDANPAWSPDGNWIAYSSDLVPQHADDLGPGAGALQNIWLMPVSNPEEKRQLTTKGGVMPSFSPDGKRIVYISYEGAGSAGAVYEIDIASGKRRRFTSGKYLDFYPTYTPDGKSIVLTRISADSNGDGQIDRKDSGQIIRIEPDDDDTDAPLDTLDDGAVDDDEYIPLTARSDHVFDSRVSGFIGGSVLVAQLKGEDINVGFIPLSGAIPARPDIRQQQTYLRDMMVRAKNKTRPCMGFKQLPTAYENSADIEVYEAISRIRLSRCDKNNDYEFQEFIRDLTVEEQAIYRLLNDFSVMIPDYRDLKGIVHLEPLADTGDPEDYFNVVLSEKKIWNEYRDGDADDGRDYQAILSFIRHEQARFYLREGRHKQAVEVIRRVIRANSAYLATDELLLESGVADSATLPALELIYLLADQRDIALVPRYFSGLKTTQVTVRPHIRRQAEIALGGFYNRQVAAGGQAAQREFLSAYPEKSHRTAHALLWLAIAGDALAKGRYAESTAAAEKVKSLAAPGSLLYYDAEIIRGKIAEVQSGAAEAIAIFSAAISSFHDSEAPKSAQEIIAKIAQYHNDRAGIFRAEGKDSEAAAEYQALLDLYLSAHANRLTKEIGGGKLLDDALDLDQVALRAAGNDEALLERILEFYDSRIDTARRFLVSEFIFGRGFLRAQLGIRTHLIAENEGLSKSAKKRVFEYFRKAEIDLNWCFFANARFADAYIMLGWMYQFIDEKREIVLDAASGKRDREIYESLYRAYFPDYLFEKNIRLYQKTLALFGKTGSPRIRNSFHLNIANNYFLLNNYSQAEAHYSSILDAKGNPDFQFESPEQQMMFYYHYGRALYFNGKNDIAARYLQYVEANLNARYPLAGLPADKQRLNQQRREIAYKIFALNSEYMQNFSAAIDYHRTVLRERKSVGADTPVSMTYLELARLQLRQGNFSSSLANTARAEKALAQEPEIEVPKFKLRIKWFWIYEPWTTIVGAFYKLSYDDVYIGENHLAFELPTVNRYQLLYSIRADIYRSKSLLHEASEALAKLIEYARKDKTKHGFETHSAAVSRRAEIEFQLKNWDTARDLYEAALKTAEKNSNAMATRTLRKNIELCRLRKLETETKPIDEKITTARKEAEEIRRYVQAVIQDRVEAVKEARKKNKDAAKTVLSQEDAAKITAEVQHELQPLMFFEGLYHAHEAELSDFADRVRPREESFDQFLERKKQRYDGFNAALKYFRGYGRDTTLPIHSAFEPDLKNNGLRLKLAMNRAKLLQEMNLYDDSIAELKEVQERSQEFRAQLEYAIATYRLNRLFEQSERGDKPGVAQYENLVNYFAANPGFLRDNIDLFERLCNIVTEKAIASGNYVQALRFEEMKRQLSALPIYFDDLKLYGEKDDLFSRLLIAEQRRTALSNHIRAARLARQGVQAPEKELADLDAQVVALRRELRRPDRLDYRYETFFSAGISEAEIARVASAGLIYVLKPRDQIYLLHAASTQGRSGAALNFYLYKPANADQLPADLIGLVRKTRARILVVAPQVLSLSGNDPLLRTLARQTTLRAAVNFSNNPDLAKRNMLQLAKAGGLLSLSSGNELDYSTPQPVSRLRVPADADKLPQHRNIIDYEADLVRKATLADNAPVTPAALFRLKGNPNFAIASRASRDVLDIADEMRYATAADLYFSAMGAGQVLHTFSPRKQAKAIIEKYLDDGNSAAGTLVTGNAVIAPGKTSVLMGSQAATQRGIYVRKIAAARSARTFSEAAAYADDAVWLFPQDHYFRVQAAELHLMLGERDQAQPHIDAIAATVGERTGRREDYAKLLLRAGEFAAFEKLLGEYEGLKAAISKSPDEYAALMQLRAFSEGNLALIAKPFAWEAADQEVSHAALFVSVSGKLRNEYLKYEICNAAMLALEFKLVAKSCVRDEVADSALLSERVNAVRWAAGYPLQLNSAELIQYAVQQLSAGYISDALSYSRRAIQSGDLGVAENLLALSLLRVLALRETDISTSREIAKQLAAISALGLTQSTNSQARRFYGLLGRAEAVLEQGARAIQFITADDWETSGVVSTRNQLMRLAQTVAPAPADFSLLRSSGFAADNGLERELTEYGELVSAGNKAARCGSACAMLTKYYLSQSDHATALKLVLAAQNADLNYPGAGVYGYTKLFAGEYYRWQSDGTTVNFATVAAVDKNAMAAVPAGVRYLLMPQRGNLLNEEKLMPSREVIMFGGEASGDYSGGAVPEVSFASARPETLHSALVAQWGSEKKRPPATFVVKPPFDAAGGLLQIYAAPVKLSALHRLKPGGYHLFCAESEPYGGFAVFVQALAENMIQRKMGVEEAYFTTMSNLGIKQASTRPLYYLYRN
ncbi:MAG: hypothetical protein U1F16_06825 [Turneriella sp.]